MLCPDHSASSFLIEALDVAYAKSLDGQALAYAKQEGKVGCMLLSSNVQLILFAIPTVLKAVRYTNPGWYAMLQPVDNRSDSQVHL